jgi:hypothetical protein
MQRIQFVGAFPRRSSCNVHKAPRCASSTNCHSTFARSASVSATASRRYLCARVSARVGVIRGPVWQSGMAVPLQRSQYSAGPAGLLFLAPLTGA